MSNPTRTYLRVGRVVTASDRGVIDDALLVIEGTRLMTVGSASEHLDELASAQVVEYPDGTALPGLIDAHCHLTLAAGRQSYEQMMLDPDEMLALIALRNLRRHLASGVTTLRDNGGRNRVTFTVRAAIDRGYFTGPRLLLSGRPLTQSRGHMHWCNGVADGADAIRTVVHRLVEEGADHIKIVASGGGTAGSVPYKPSYTAAEMHVAVEVAHELGRLTTAHCRAKESMVNAVEAGLDCIEHAEFLVPGELADLGRGLPAGGIIEFDPRVAEQMLEAGVFVSFTFQAGGYDTLLELRAKRDRTGLYGDETAHCQRLEDYFERKSGLFNALLAGGFLNRLVISTDSGCFDGEFGRLHLGLVLAVQAGMTPLQAIAAATRTAAEACGLGSQIGSLESGMEADLVVVRGNPLNDMNQIRETIAVYRGGMLVGPGVL